MKKILILMVLFCFILSSAALACSKEADVTYDDKTDYISLMLEAAIAGDLSTGALYEQQRNLKIVSMNLDLDQTKFFTIYSDSAEIVMAIQDYIYPPLYSEQDAVALGKLMYGEARGIASRTEQACIPWTVLNRFDAGYGNSIWSIVTAPNQFAYKASYPTTDDFGRDLKALATDVLERWEREKYGQTNVGRVLPKDYYWYHGDGRHNYFRNAYRSGSYWDYSLTSPYED